MNWNAFKRRKKTGKNWESSLEFAIFSVLLFIGITLEIYWEQAGVGSKYHVTSISLKDNPYGYWGAIAFQTIMLLYFVKVSFTRYKNSKRYLKGRDNAL